MHFNTKGSIRTSKKEKWILLQKQTLDKQGCPLYYNKLKTTKKIEFVIIQTTTRKNKNEFYINKNIVTRKTHGNRLNITKKAFKQGNKWRGGIKDVNLV